MKTESYSYKSLLNYPRCAYAHIRGTLLLDDCVHVMIQVTRSSAQAKTTGIQIEQVTRLIAQKLSSARNSG